MFMEFFSLTNKLTQWSRVLLENLTLPQLVMSFPSRFITAFARTRYLFFSWARLIHSTLIHHICFKSIVILPFSLRVDIKKDILSFEFSHQNPASIFLRPHIWHTPRPSHCSWLDHSNSILWGVIPWMSSLCNFLQALFPSSLLGPSVFLSSLFSNVLSL
jgi:hypothetical protein